MSALLITDPLTGAVGRRASGAPLYHRGSQFGPPERRKLDRNLVAKILFLAEALDRRTRGPRQHGGLLKAKGLDVLRALLRRFYCYGTGECFPSYDAIALEAFGVTFLRSDIEGARPAPQQARKDQRMTDRTKVFIVHGHDEGARETVARFIEKLGFDPIILHKRANKGRTIITKFREEADDVGFAVVLMTSDDVGCAAPSSPEKLRPRARQNVVFELGFFIGALGPEHVAALVKGNIERPSDFDGVVYISLDDGQWRMDLARELKTAGYAIDFNKVI